MKKLRNKIYNLLTLSFTLLLISGCGGGGSGGGSLGFLSGGGGDGGGTVVASSGSDAGAPIHNPEPSTLILLGSGLIGMAIYARARLKGRGKK